jgi:hypothetical protein
MRRSRNFKIQKSNTRETRTIKSQTPGSGIGVVEGWRDGDYEDEDEKQFADFCKYTASERLPDCYATRAGDVARLRRGCGKSGQ